MQDIEAIREAMGYEKLVLYGTSYGTKVALEYAERYPEHVEALVLDSVVLPEGPEPFSLSSIAGARAGARRALLGRGVRAHHRQPAQRHRHPGHAAAPPPAQRLGVRRGPGTATPPRSREADLYNVLVAGDLNPALRALLPAAVQSALRSDPDPLLRLKALSEGLIPNVPLHPRGSQAEREAGEEEDNALFLATSCEEKPFPWQRSATPATREAEALAALHALPSSDFYPFDAATAWADSLVPVCKDWPNAAPAAARREPAAERADADPLRRPGPAHPHRQRARDRRARSPTRSCSSSPTPATPCSAATSATARRTRSKSSSRARRAGLQARTRPLQPHPHHPHATRLRAAGPRPAAAPPGAPSPRCSTRSWTSSAR